MKNTKLLIIPAVAALGLGATALAGAATGDDHALSGTPLERASKAALEATGGGHVNQTERDGEDGATYEVEVAKRDGSQVDVRLDANYKVVVIEPDHEG